MTTKEKNITELIPKKKYRIDIEAGKKHNGERNRIVKYAESMKEARIIRDDILYNIRNDKIKSKGNIGFYEFAKIWLVDYAEANVKASTLYGYRCNLNAYILPEFKDMKLNEIKSIHLERFYNKLKKRNTKRPNLDGSYKQLSSTTIQKQHRQLSLIFNCAIKWDFLDSNPCLKVIKPPTQQSPEMSFFEEKEIEEVLRLLEYEQIGFRTAITMLIMGGFRRAELLGLYWEDIDFENMTASVKRNLLELRGREGLTEDTTKTLKSVRTIKLPSNIMKMLNEYKDYQLYQFGQAYIKEMEKSYVFKSVTGGYMYPSWLTFNWKKFVAKNNIKKVRLHDLRHTCATMLISNNIPIATVSKMLGHSNVYTTLNTYTHSTNTDEDSAANMFDEKFF